MDYRKAILGAASVLALITGAQGPANASIDPGNGPEGSVTSASIAAGAQSDPLFDFIMLSNGGETIENAIQGVFGNASREQIQNFPQFLGGLATLGLPAEAVAKSKDALIEIVYAAATLDDDMRVAVVAQLEEAPKPIQLAAEETKEREPKSTGSTEGAAGGAYQ